MRLALDFQSPSCFEGDWRAAPPAPKVYLLANDEWACVEPALFLLARDPGVELLRVTNPPPLEQVPPERWEVARVPPCSMTLEELRAAPPDEGAKGSSLLAIAKRAAAKRAGPSEARVLAYLEKFFRAEAAPDADMERWLEERLAHFRGKRVARLRELEQRIAAVDERMGQGVRRRYTEQDPIDDLVDAALREFVHLNGRYDERTGEYVGGVRGELVEELEALRAKTGFDLLREHYFPPKRKRNAAPPVRRRLRPAGD